MKYISISVPSYPFFLHAGNALYRPGDKHQSRKDLNFFDMLFVEKGTLFITVDNTEFSLHANDILIIPPKAVHKGTRICSEETLFHWLHFSTKESYEVIQLSESATGVINNLTNSILLAQYQTLLNDAAQKALSLLTKLETSLINFYTHSNTHIKQELSLFSQQEIFLRLLHILSHDLDSSGTVDIAGAVMQYLSTHYMEEVTLSNLAKMLNCHPNHLIRCFKEKYHLPPIQMLINFRLDKACKLLTSSNVSVTTVAYTVGFSSTSYFCKQFKTKFHCSPREYRANKKE